RHRECRRRRRATPGHGSCIIVLIGECETIVGTGNRCNGDRLLRLVSRELTRGRGERYIRPAYPARSRPIEVSGCGFAHRHGAGIAPVAILRTAAGIRIYIGWRYRYLCLATAP